MPRIAVESTPYGQFFQLVERHVVECGGGSPRARVAAELRAYLRYDIAPARLAHCKVAAGSTPGGDDCGPTHLSAHIAPPRANPYSTTLRGL